MKLHIWRGIVIREILCSILAGATLLQSAAAAAPSWWGTSGVVNQHSADDYGALNQGQLKNFVRAAIVEMQERVPNGAGAPLLDLIDSWNANAASHDDYAAVNEGQVKNVVKLVYDRLKEVGYATSYPWSHGSRAAQDYALANVGQLKNLLNLDFTKDADRDGVADWLKSVDAAKQFDPATWLPVDTAGTIFADSEHHSRSSQFGYAARGGPIALPPDAANILNDPVMSIPGEFKVGPDGTARYTVRIESPKGIAGVEPGISLEYNSAVGNGIAGVGWGIGGLMLISRGPATAEVDGFYDPADFDDNDRFYLDGERLLCVSGTYGTDGSEYRTLKEQFFRVVYHKNSTENWFEVWSKSGLRMEFGHGTTSRSLPPGQGGLVATWALDKVADGLGNYWQAVYCDTSGTPEAGAGANVLPEFAPSSVLYTGTTAAAPMHQIQFHYEERPDAQTAYLMGARVVKSRRLKHVEVRTGSYSHRTYTLDYEQGDTTGRSRLKQLKLKAGSIAGALTADRICPATTFDWSQGTPGWSRDQYLSAGLTTTQRDTEEARLKLKMPFITLDDPLAVGALTFRLSMVGQYDVGYNYSSLYQYTISAMTEQVGAAFTDLNGDGLNDVVTRYAGLRHSGPFYVFNPANAFDTASGVYADCHLDVNNATNLLINQGAGRWDDRSSQFQGMSSFPYLLSGFGQCGQFGDFNGDGLPDVVSQDPSFARAGRMYPPIWNRRNFLASQNPIYSAAFFGGENRYPRRRCNPGIYDQSNTTGIWFSEPAATVPWRPATTTEASSTTGYGLPLVIDENFDQSGTFQLQYVSFGSTLKPVKGWQVVDMDGDGDMDIIRGGQGPNASALMGAGRELCFGLRNNGPAASGAKWTVMSSGMWQLPLPLVSRNGDKDLGRRLIDMNRDGLPDFVFQRLRDPAPSGTPAWTEYEKYETVVYLNRGDAGWEDGGAAWTLPGEGFMFDTYAAYGRRLMDVNGDTLPDFVASWKYKDTTNAEQFYQRVYLNTGAGWTADQPSWYLPKALQVAEKSPVEDQVVSQSYHRFLADVNGDGQPEFIDAWKDAQAEIDATGIAAPQVWERTGAGWALMSGWDIPADFLPRPRAFSEPMSKPSDTLPADPAKGWLEDWTDSPLQLADMNGDGLLDLLHSNTSRTATYWNKSAQEKITTITSGMGVPITINYDTLPRLGTEPDTPEHPHRYVRGTKPSYAQSDVVPMSVVVTDYSTPDGIGGAITSRYRYGGHRHNSDRSLGFEWIEVSASNSRVVQYAEFYQTPKEMVGLPKKTESYYMEGATKIVLSESQTIYATLDTATALEGSLVPGPKARFCYASESISKRRDPENNLLASVTSSSTYDSWGGLLTQTFTHGDGSQLSTTNTFEPAVTAGTSWLIGRLATNSVTRNAPVAQAGTAPPVITHSAFTYHASTGLLESVTLHPGTAKAVVRTLYRDNFGNIVKTVITAAGEPDAMVSESWYDASGRFPVATKNSLGHTVVSTFDATRSLLLSMSEPFANGAPTADAAHAGAAPTAPGGTPASSFVHDDWGTTRISTGPDGLRAVRFTKEFASSALPQARYYVYEQGEGTAPSISYYDCHHRVLLTETSGFDGKPVLQRVTYDAKGRTTHTTNPYFHDASAIPTTEAEYDDFDRQFRTTAPDGTQSTISHNGLTVTTQVVGTARQQIVSHDEQGRVVQTQDARGNTVTLFYTADGLVQRAVTTPADGGAVTEIASTYDPITRASTSTTDANTGTVQSFYDGFGRLERTLDAMNVEHHFTHDRLGRTLTRQTSESTTTWVYDDVTSGSNGLGQVGTVSHTTTGAGSAATTQESIVYDSLGRVVRSTLSLAGQPAFNGQYTTIQGYDDLGRVTTTTDPGGFTTQNEYNAFGFKSGLREVHPTQTRVLWRAGAYDAEGKLLQERLGNGITTDSRYHPTRGTLQSATSYRPGLGGASSRSLQKLELEVGNLGNVESRKSTTYDASGAATVREESFTHDDLNRLTTSHVAGQNVQTFVFGDNGNIASKTGVGTYTYDSVRKHAVASVTAGGTTRAYAYDGNGRMTTEHVQQAGQENRLIRQINYNSFHQPSAVTHHASPKLSTDRALPGGLEGSCQVLFYYGADLQRLIQVKMKGQVKTQTLYLGAYEVREVYEDAGATLVEREQRSSFGCGARIRRFSEGTSLTIPVVKTEFTLEDHLGSTSAVHDENGEVEQSQGQQPQAERHSYDSWGARRKAATWAPAATQPTSPPVEEDEPQVGSSHPAGFTGHEMLDDVGLIHMNGRLYDPALGRLCSVDPFVQNPADSQSHNRYSYVRNNPLGATDPSGYSEMIVLPEIVITADRIIGGYGGSIDYSSLDSYLKSYNELISNINKWLANPTGSLVITQLHVLHGINPVDQALFARNESVPMASHKQQDPQSVVHPPPTTEAAPGTDQPAISSGSTGDELKASAKQAVADGETAGPSGAIHADAHGGKAGGGAGGKSSTDKVLDGIQGTLDVIGVVPGLGEVADGISGLMSLARGNYGEAALSFGAMVPFVGWGATAAKFGLKYGDEALAVARHVDDVSVVNKGLGSRGVRNTTDLTETQMAQLRTYAGQVGLRGSDVRFVRGPSRYSDMTNQIWLGQDVLTAPASQRLGGTVFERLSPRAVIAHEAGHLRTTRAGIDLPRGSTLLDEVQASLIGRQLPGLNRVERYQLLRDAAERARNEGTTLRALLPLLSP